MPFGPTNHKVLNPLGAPPTGLHFSEHWTHPGTGQRLRRTSLGATTSGHLLLHPVGHSGPVDLLFRGPSIARGTFSPALLATATAGWYGMLHKPPATWHAIKLRDELYWLSRLPRAEYLLESNGDGVELFRVERLVRRPRG